MKINLKITPATIEEDFARIANELMNSWVLTVNKTYYRITEIEFYCKSVKDDGPIKDPYTHGHDEQLKSGTWYFHGSGIDLTFGCEEYYGGILIRGIYNLETQDYIKGPLNSITEILSNLSSFYAHDFKLGLASTIDYHAILHEPKTPIKAPRVGLNPKIDSDSHQKLYRFLIMPKFTNRDKSIIYNSLLKQGYSPDQANHIWK